MTTLKNGCVADYLPAGSLVSVRENWDFYILVARASILLVCVIDPRR